MLKVNYYYLKNEKVTEKKRIILIADIHLCDNYNDELIIKLLDKVRSLNPNYICVCGDIIDEFRYLNIVSNQKYLIRFLNNLASITQTIITLGSHDFMNQKKLKTGNISAESIKYWKKIIKDNNNLKLVLLDNEIYEDLNIRIIGYTPSRDYYRGEDKNILIEEINSKFKRISDDKFNVLMCHSPLRFSNNLISKLNIGQNLDLILSGHMHDGLMFPILKKIPTSIGLISPKRELFPINTRGKKIFELNGKKIILIITGGILKFSNMAPNICKKFNFLYNNDIDCIDIDK